MLRRICFPQEPRYKLVSIGGEAASLLHMWDKKRATDTVVAWPLGGESRRMFRPGVGGLRHGHRCRLLEEKPCYLPHVGDEADHEEQNGAHDDDRR